MKIKTLSQIKMPSLQWVVCEVVIPLLLEELKQRLAKGGALEEFSPLGSKWKGLLVFQFRRRSFQLISLG